MEGVQVLPIADSVWVIGNSQEGLRFSEQTWVKWGVHKAGENSDGSGGMGDPKVWKRTNGNQLSILVRGSFTWWLKTGDAEEYHTIAGEPGCIIYAHGLEHKWKCDEDSLVITVRWEPE